MKLIYPQIFISFLLILVTFIGCEDTITGSEIDKVVIPNENVSYSQYIQPVLNVKCATSGCHDDGTRAGDLSVTNWANVVIPGVVDAYNEQTSRLVWRIEGLGVDFMPPVNSIVGPLTPNQIKGIKTWITEGAKNN